jgi:hypothetical protein
MARQKVPRALRQTKKSLLVKYLVRRATSTHRSISMLDIVMLAIGLGFFALTVGYAFACDRL